MTQGRLFQARGRSGTSLTDTLAAYFKARPNTWIDARELLSVAGFAGWRTRVSELRSAPYLMVIENRTKRENGLTKSFYRYVPESVQKVSAA